MDAVQWKIPTIAGIDFAAAYGIAAAPTAEDAVQGIHAANVLLVVDEAGGISQTIGQNMVGLLTGDNAAMVAIGNPPTDNEGSWFERLCAADRTSLIRIAAGSTPNFTGEVVAMCQSCPPAVPPHPCPSTWWTSGGWPTPSPTTAPTAGSSPRRCTPSFPGRPEHAAAVGVGA